MRKHKDCLSFRLLLAPASQQMFAHQSNWDQPECGSPPSTCDLSASNLNFSNTNDRPVVLRVASCPDHDLLRSQRACNLDSSIFSDSTQTYYNRVCGDRSFAFKLARSATDPGCLNPHSDFKIDGGMPHRTLDPQRYETTPSTYGKRRLPVADIKNRWRSEQIANQLRATDGPGRPRNFWESWALSIPRLPFTKVTRRG